MIALDSAALQGIREVCKLSQDEHVLIVLEPNLTRFIGYNAESFRILELPSKNPKSFRFRVMVDSLSSALAVGVLMIVERETKVFLINAHSEDDIKANKFEILIAVPKQSEILTVASEIKDLMFEAKYLTPFEVHNIEGLRAFERMSSVSGGGVILNNEQMHTSGPGYKAFTMIPKNDLKFGITTSALKVLTRFTQNMNRVLFKEVKNYVICQHENQTLGFKKMRVKNFNEMEGFKELILTNHMILDLKAFLPRIKDFKATKHESYIFEFKPSNRIVSLEEKRRGIMNYQMGVSMIKGDLVDFKLDFKMFKDVMSTINISKTVFNVRIFADNRIVQFTNEDGINILFSYED